MKIVRKSCKIALSAVLCIGIILPVQALAETNNYYINDNNVVDNMQKQQQEFSVDDINFYINLGGNVLDTKLGSTHYLSDLFTSSVGYLETDGGVLQQKVKANKNYYMFIDNYYDSIVGADENDYANIDSQIRSAISAPSDASVLANVKSQIENGAEVNDINGDKISSTLVSDIYFDVYWYVLKEGNKYWHADGILKKKDVPLVNTYTVDYTWAVPENSPGLPDNIILPSTVTYAENDNVKIDEAFTSGRIVKVEGGQYEFMGWDKQDFTITGDTTVKGEWKWLPNEPIAKGYNVTTCFKYFENGHSLADDVVETYLEGSSWACVAAPSRIVIEDMIYVYSHTTGDEKLGTDICDNQVVTHWYVLEKAPIENVYSLTQEYKIDGTDISIADTWANEVAESSSWEFIDAPKEIQYNGKTYKLKEVTGDDKVGDCIFRDMTRTAWYIEKQDDKIVNLIDNENSSIDDAGGSAPILAKTGDNVTIVTLLCLLFVFAASMLTALYALKIILKKM